MAVSRLSLAVAVLSLAACKHHDPNTGDDTVDAAPTADAACDGLSCFVVDCAMKGLPATSVSGTVYAPNGTLPLYGVNIYVPLSDPGPLVDGVRCDNCATGFQGGSLAQTVTDEAGHFTLEGVPATANVPIVIQVGKWRRQLTLPNVAACQDLALPATDTRLPKNKSEGDIPKIAITTGAADALECLVRKLGIDDAEFTTATEDGRVHLYTGNGVTSFAATHPGGARPFTAATTLWSTVDELKPYDITMLSCEGDQYITGDTALAGPPNTKPLTALQALHDYADLGGRVFMSHWHNVWIGGKVGDKTYGMADWVDIAQWAFGAAQNETTQLTIVDETVPKGMSFATWLMNVGASTVRDEVTVSEPRYTCNKVLGDAERWVYVDPARSTPLGKESVQDLLFTTPNNLPADQRCGKVVFSDMHVASGSLSPRGGTFPTSCSSNPLTPQEKALAFIFFDISSCVGVIQ